MSKNREGFVDIATFMMTKEYTKQIQNSKKTPHILLFTSIIEYKLFGHA